MVKKKTVKRSYARKKTVVPENGMTVKDTVKFAPGDYLLPDGITIAADNISIDATGANFIGSGRLGSALKMKNRKGVKIKGLSASFYYHGIRIENCSGITVENCTITATSEIPSDTIFLNIWMPADKAYGGALYLSKVTDAVIRNNNFEHNLNGILTYDCANLKIKKNAVNYCSGFGIHLLGTCDSLFEENAADYCCRYNVRNTLKGIKRTGHMGADATGFLILTGSHNNVFRRNYARMGGDGFFLAGCNPKGGVIGANNNLFEENDASLSPNIAFEATFSRGNVFRNNFANNGNFGFWLGFSTENIVENNRIVGNRIGGIAVENGWDMQVRHNTFHGNGHGILLWSTEFNPKVMKKLPGCETSHDWHISNNIFNRNSKAIRIAAMQDHGLRDREREKKIKKKLRPYNHTIVDNNIQDNRLGIELVNCDNTVIERNILHHNPEANIVQTDCTGTVLTYNLGSIAAYLK